MLMLQDRKPEISNYDFFFFTLFCREKWYLLVSTCKYNKICFKLVLPPEKQKRWTGRDGEKKNHKNLTYPCTTAWFHQSQFPRGSIDGICCTQEFVLRNNIGIVRIYPVRAWWERIKKKVPVKKYPSVNPFSTGTGWTLYKVYGGFRISYGTG